MVINRICLGVLLWLCIMAFHLVNNVWPVECLNFTVILCTKTALLCVTRATPSIVLTARAINLN